MITNIRIGIPVGYDQWKEHIETMNKERQRKQALDGQNARTPKGASGATTSSAPKKTITGTTYRGRGQLMDINTMKSRNCFCCGEKGHISKNCLLQSWNKGKQEVRVSTTEPSVGSKIEEVKDSAGKLHQVKVAATDADTCGPSPKRKSPLQEREAECPIGNGTSVPQGREAAKHMPPMVAQHEWLKPFETEWTWRAIKDTKDESIARAILLNWIHKT
ncbi:uncharacterized protein ARMOST_06988 [Armillaria ostoyae]|uniref:CCHC-type domain-containing protein n=1 Tax=Armillaria ostoyae TaxID=47428 RepID=A0A284R4I6_ARMOS|nr:uncharacterized protein ARMOST_06988 [Armillaria ostoyae]